MFQQGRVMLGALEFLKWREIGIRVVEVGDEADSGQTSWQVVKEDAALRLWCQRPAAGVQGQTGALVFDGKLPELLRAPEHISAARVRGQRPP